VALVAAVAGVAFVAAVAVSVGHWVLAGTRLATSTADALQAEALLRSGIAIASVLLEERALQREADSLRGVLGPEPIVHPLGRGNVALTIEDAARRLDLGAPDLAPAVRRLLRGLGLDPALADTLADWIDPDDTPRPHGAERAWYLAAHPPLVPANAPLGAVSQLRLVRGYDAATLARLSPFVATAGEHAVNPNTASLAVLAAWLGDETAARAMLARRARAPISCTGMPACTTRSQFYLVRVEARVLGTRRGVWATLWVPPLGAAEVRSVVSSASEEGRQAEDVT
jgi:general secretion pathway protein K